jgi:hypothetical protein
MNSRIGRLVLLATLSSALLGCGRSSLMPANCVLGLSATALDFGEVLPGATVSRTLLADNSGSGICRLDPIAVTAASDPGFSVTIASPLPLEIGPNQETMLSVSFSPPGKVLPLSRKGTLSITSNDGTQPIASVALTARIQSTCKLSVVPSAVDFGTVPLGSTADRTVLVTDVGIGPCELGNIAIGTGSDSEFILPAGQAPTLDLQPGDSAPIQVSFVASDVMPPHHRTGTLVFQSSDTAQAEVTVPLSADIDVGCNLTITPPSLDFGNVILNTTVTAPVTLGNDGTSSCVVTSLTLGAGTDPGFTLSSGQTTTFVVAVGASVAIPVSFTANDSAPPHLKTGTLDFKTGNSRMPTAVVPLSAYVNTVCVEASQWIYVVDDRGLFAKFDPATLTFTDIAQLQCGESSTPNSMAVDQNAVAWVAYQDGRMFQVDTTTGACTPTNFQVGQDGLVVFGMGFVFDPNTGNDTLYIAGGGSTQVAQSTLATVSMPGLIVSPVGTVDGLPELSGLGDGTLWGFVPDFEAVNKTATLTQIDPANGNTIVSYSYPTLTGTSSWAMKFWGGYFYIFVGDTIFQVSRNAPKTYSTALLHSGRNVVGAGVSTCAPLQ